MIDTESSTRVHRRNRSSSSLVLWTDYIAKHVITIGGIGTILVVLMVVLVLLGNVIPLFRRAIVTPVATLDFSRPVDDSQTILAFGIDEYTELVWLFHADHRLTVRSVLTSLELAEYKPSEPLASDQRITSVCVDGSNTHMLVGYSDGTVRPVALKFDVGFRKLADFEPKIADALATGPVVHEGSVYRLTAGNLVRQSQLTDVQFQEPVTVFKGPIETLNCLVINDTSGFAESTQWIWGASSGSQVALGTLEQKPAMLGDGVESTSRLWLNNPSDGDASEIAREHRSGGESGPVQSGPVRGVMVGPRGDSLRSIDAQGEITWWLADDGDRLARSQSYLTITGSESLPTCTEPLLGRSTWLIGGKSGHVEGVAEAATDRGRELLSIRRIHADTKPVEGLACSPSSRIFGVLTEGGTLQLRHATSERQLARWQLPADARSQAEGDSPWQVQFNANGDSFALLSPTRLWIWDIDAPFPEASLATFFSPVWYEGYAKPMHNWQSSTGSVEGESKYGLWPLIFGTLKATIYSMLIAAPIALMAAIYGSEFISRTWRLRFKPLIELMASVPSVVLGFIGAMVLAPFLRDYLAWFLLSGLLILVFFLLAAHLWMLIPSSRAIPLRKYRLPIMFAVPFVALLVAWFVARPIEQWIFQTSITNWLGDQGFGPWPGWFMLSILPVGLFVVWCVNGPLNSLLQRPFSGSGHVQQSVFRLTVFLTSCVVAVVLSMLSASLLSGMGWDARGNLIGPYQERNALLVGGILGFAIIPLVYTLADDALQSVPQHLRSASLACGATVWQTTIRVVVPTAMSGLFSALMIGFGRAIGETMVVLMAAGNTPLMDINPFNGFRTLSATLATELPEAARGSTHFHTLFLAALLLFFFTLLVNSCAEWVRLRFRKRAYQL